MGYAHWFMSIRDYKMKDHSISVYQAIYATYIVAKYLDTVTVKMLGEEKYSPSVVPSWKEGSARFSAFYKALVNEPYHGVRRGICKVDRSQFFEQRGLARSREGSRVYSSNWDWYKCLWQVGVGFIFWSLVWPRGVLLWEDSTKRLITSSFLYVGIKWANRAYFCQIM